jgi:hypothetical protein
MDERTEMPHCTECGEARLDRWHIDGTDAFLCRVCVAAAVAYAEAVNRRLREVSEA